MAASVEIDTAAARVTAITTGPEDLRPPVDVVVVRLEVRDHCAVPLHLVYNWSTADMASSEGECRTLLTLSCLVLSSLAWWEGINNVTCMVYVHL